jgi:hypothetical protein
VNTFRTRTECHVASRAHRLDPRQESRWSLVLIMLMGFATLSVMAATQAMSNEKAEPVILHSQR